MGILLGTLLRLSRCPEALAAMVASAAPHAAAALAGCVPLELEWVLATAEALERMLGVAVAEGAAEEERRRTYHFDI